MPEIAISDLVKSMNLSKLPSHLYLKKGIDLSRFAKKYEEIDSKFSESTYQFRFSSSIQPAKLNPTTVKPINSARFAIDASRKKSLKKLSNPEGDFLKSLKQSFSPGPTNIFQEAFPGNSYQTSARLTTSAISLKGHKS